MGDFERLPSHQSIIFVQNYCYATLPEFLFLDMLCIKVEIQFVQIVNSSTEQQNRILVLSTVADLDPGVSFGYSIKIR